MPYARNSELPTNVRSALPSEAQSVYRGAFNAADEKYPEARARRIAWGAVRNAGWKPPKGDGKWTKKGYDDPNHPAYTLQPGGPGSPDFLSVEEIGGPLHMSADEIRSAQAAGKVVLRGEVVKIDTEKQWIFGWGYVCRKANGELVVDHSGEIVDIETLEEAGYDYCLHARDMKAMHKGETKGALIELFVSTPEKRKAMGIPDGILPDAIWLGFKVEDKGAWEDVKSGETRMFSLGGLARRRELRS